MKRSEKEEEGGTKTEANQQETEYNKNAQSEERGRGNACCINQLRSTEFSVRIFFGDGKIVYYTFTYLLAAGIIIVFIMSYLSL